MGKSRHSQDKLWITYKELVQDWGGKGDNNINKNSTIKKLPFYCCSLSFMPVKDPVCLQDGTIFDLVNILPYIKKFQKNPVTGKPLKASDLIKLNFSKNSEGEYHCPITYKSFSDNSTIIAIKESGNVYSYEAYEELNKKPKSFKDLVTNQPFDPKNIIIIQDPKRTDERNINEFDFIKNKEDIDFIKLGHKDTSNVNLSSTYASIIENYDENADEEQLKRKEILNMINNKQNIEEEDERSKKIKFEFDEFEKNLKIFENEILAPINSNEEKIENIHKFKKLFGISPNCFIKFLKGNENNKILKSISTKHDRFSEGKASSSFTSTSLNINYSNKFRILSDDEIRNKTYYSIVKTKQLKGYVRMNTNFGFLNLQIHCDMAPKTSENFLELCENGYYNNLIFHRLVKGFVLQGGDPTGTGTGGSSIYGKAFADEFHPKLLHSERGILSMANSGKNTNASQFFITLKPTPHLDNVHSIFGQVVGNLKVLDDIEKVGSDKKGKPNADIKILSMEVFTNPFRDAISDLLIKDYSEKFVSENLKLENEKEKKIEEKLKNLSQWPQGNINQEEGVGKYLNKKRNIDNYQDYQDSIFNKGNILDTNIVTDPYIYEKPINKKNKKREQFDFSSW